MSEIEARPTRVPSPYGAEIRDKGKGEAAEVGNGSCAVFCWLVGEDPPDCHNLWSAIEESAGRFRFCRYCRLSAVNAPRERLRLFLFPNSLARTTKGRLPPTAESNQFRVGMECAYAPSNWQESAATAANVPVENVAGAYTEGYDVQIARILADQLDHASSFLVYARLYTAHLISAESSVTSIRSINCAATIFFSSKLSSEKTSLSGMAGLDFSRLRDARISSRSFSRRASAR